MNCRAITGPADQLRLALFVYPVPELQSFAFLCFHTAAQLPHPRIAPEAQSDLSFSGTCAWLRPAGICDRMILPIMENPARSGSCDRGPRMIPNSAGLMRPERHQPGTTDIRVSGTSPSWA